MSQEKIKVGQTVFLKYIGGIHKRSKEIFPAVVATVGNKYFTVKHDSVGEKSRFEISSLVHDGGQYSPQWKVYLSKEAILDEQEMERLLTVIRNTVGIGGKTNLSIFQCRKIVAIIQDK